MKNEREKFVKNYNFKKTIFEISDYVDFKKILENLEDIKKEIEIFNKLIGSKDIKNDFKNLIKENNEIYKVIPILIAIRRKKKDGFHYLNNLGISRDLKFQNFEIDKIEEYVDILDKSGIFNLMSENVIKDLETYILGVEVGLDTNARKNRVGKIMEELVSSKLKKLCKNKKFDFFEQKDNFFIKKELGYSVFDEGNEKETQASPKKFDFIVRTKENLYLIETNFYSSAGSKINETSKSYIELNKRIQESNDVRFIWITDGGGWTKTMKSLFYAISNIKYLIFIEELDSQLEKIIL